VLLGEHGGGDGAGEMHRDGQNHSCCIVCEEEDHVPECGLNYFLVGEISTHVRYQRSKAVIAESSCEATNDLSYKIT
jgi:hypothetical protein